MSHFLHHEPCPRCGSRDNLGVWSDGHKFCFGCRYFVPSPENVSAIKSRIDDNYNKNENYMVFDFDASGLTSSLPVEPLAWLKKYGISDNEISHYELLWNPKTSSLVFPIYDSKRQLIYCQERYFGPKRDVPKYVTHGSKTQKLGFITNKTYPKSCVLVEDFVSAIKVARICTTAPLLGSTIDAEGVKWIVGRFKQVRVWLDLDKATQSLREASKLKPAISDVRSILTPLDPKDYSTDRINQIIKESGVKNG